MEYKSVFYTMLSCVRMVLSSTGIYTTTGVTQTCKDRVGNCVSYGSKICTGTYQKWAELNCKDYCGLCVSTVLVPTAGPLAPSLGTCADEIGNCTLYDKTICSGAYHVWAKQHCADFCGFCTTQVTKQTIVINCTHSLPNCNNYGKYVCQDPYLDWAKQNCASHCGFCGGQQQVTKPLPCIDIDEIPNCHAHSKSVCQGLFLEWAKVNCRHFCGLCILSTSGATQTCKDRVGNCVSYGSKICTGTYQKWAEINCKDYCGLCVSTVLAPTAAPLAPSLGTCADEIGNCTLYDKTICSGVYQVWAKQHCADFCGFCTTQQVTKQAIGTQQVTKQTIDANCTGSLPNCNDYGKSVCQDPYLDWAKQNCAGYCGLCGGQQQVTKPLPCIDAISNCHAHTKYACEGPYVEWAKQHCRLFCGLCTPINLVG